MPKMFPRLSELVSLTEKDEKSRFYRFWDSFYDNPDRVNAFTLVEEDIAALDEESWSFLKTEANTLALTSHEDRGWNQLFEKLNEAKGYKFLTSVGCSCVSFIPRSKNKNIETPDLIGKNGNFFLLAEVKTINTSRDLILARKSRSGMSATNQLTPPLQKKLMNTFSKAASQLNTHLPSLNPQKYIYLVAHFDDEIDYRCELNAQAIELFNSMELQSINLVIHGENTK